MPPASAPLQRHKTHSQAILPPYAAPPARVSVTGSCSSVRHDTTRRMQSLCVNPVVHGISLAVFFGGARAPPAQISALGRGVSLQSLLTCSLDRKSFLLAGEKGNDGVAREGSASVGRGGRKGEEDNDDGGEEEEEEDPLERRWRGNWVLRILRIASLWGEKARRSSGGIEERTNEAAASGQGDCCSCCCDEQGSEVCCVGDVEEAVAEFDRESFPRMLTRVALAEAREYAKMSYLGILAYRIPKIKPGNLLKTHGLRFITSSLEKKTGSMNEEKAHTPVMEKKPQPFHDQERTLNQPQIPEKEVKEEYEVREAEKRRRLAYRISASAAYQIAATAASYLRLQTRNILLFRSMGDKITEKSSETIDDSIGKTEPASLGAASFEATTSSVTAVVAGKEEMKQAVAKELSSAKLSPCEWFSCDDDSRATRFFVIQGSDSLASWQANLLFEPVQFEGLDVLVHRGIYEVAKGIYEQMLPAVQAHLQSYGDCAILRFTGHSLGGSLSLLVNLMLLIRGEVPRSSLLPVVTFGAPSIMCGGDQLLQRLSLPRSHVQAITMHRDIVPRAFSCCYPDHVVDLLMAVNGNFRRHPCLKKQRMMYAPMGELIILQPDDKISPHHPLLPSGNGLYLLTCPVSVSNESARQLWAAQSVFFNTPHPLEILSDPSAYGNNGAVLRDHDMYSYLQSIRSIVRQELEHSRKAKREQRRQTWWPLLAPLQGFNATDSTVILYSLVTFLVGLSITKFCGVSSHLYHLALVSTASPKPEDRQALPVTWMHHVNAKWCPIMAAMPALGDALIAAVQPQRKSKLSLAWLFTLLELRCNCANGNGKEKIEINGAWKAERIVAESIASKQNITKDASHPSVLQTAPRTANGVSNKAAEVPLNMFLGRHSSF
ncbi:hypothetical protein ACLOJK_017683 [Asimina triloba]